MSEPTNQFRYPGLRSFTLEQKGIFFGRSRETRELFNLIAVEKTVALFSKSGLGKTSLLNAGVTPLLLESDIFPVPIRFGNDDLLPEQHFSLQFDIAYRQFTGQDARQAEDTSAKETMWEQAKRCPFVRNGQSYTPVLLFDQFEELFTLYPQPEKRRRFVAELADLIGEKLPAALRERLLDRFDAGEIAATDLATAEKAPPLKFVFSIRSDMLHFMDELSEQIPYILRSRYQLFGLSDEQAREAIVLPAQKQDPRFACPAFGYTPEALDDILSTLTKNREVESFQLQAVCQALEEKILKGRQQSSFDSLELMPFADEANPPFPSSRFGKSKEENSGQAPLSTGEGMGVRLLTPDFYGHQEGIARILEDFYQKRLEELPGELQQPARLLIEDALINENGRRRSVGLDDLLLREGVNQTLLNLLEQNRLVRREPRLETFYYEISHDTLLAPILKFRKEREAEQERLTAIWRREQAEATAKEEERKRKQAEQQRRQARTLAAAAILGLLVAVWQYRQADTAQKAAITEKNHAERARITADSLRKVSEVALVQAQKSDSLARVQQTEAERQKVLALQNAATANQNLRQMQIANAARKLAEQDKQQAEIRKLLQEASVFERAGEKPHAIAWLRGVLRLEPTNGEAKRRLKILEKEK